MSTIKLIVCDLDGTLICNNETLPDNFTRLEQSLKDRDIMFTLVTGRSYSMAKRIIDKLNIEHPYIINNGGQIRYNEKVIFEKSFKALTLRRTFEVACSLGMSVIFCHSDGKDTIMRKTPWTREKYSKFGIYGDVLYPSKDQWKNISLQKVTIIDKDFKINRILDGIERNSEVSSVLYDNGGIEIMARDLNKANAVRQLADIYEIELSNVLAIGNDVNDIEMLEECGVGVAVGNAAQAVKDIADYVCEDNLGEGVFEAINKYCLISSD